MVQKSKLPDCLAGCCMDSEEGCCMDSEEQKLWKCKQKAKIIPVNPHAYNAKNLDTGADHNT